MTNIKEKFADLIQAINDSPLQGWLDIEYALEDCSSWDDFIEYCEDRIREKEVIYYTKAIKYLAENDPSLHDSLELAQEFGYEVSGLNSELLATLLLQQNLMNALHELDNFEELFEDEE